MTTNNIETQKSTAINETNLTPEQEKQVKKETKKIIQENAQISLEDFKKSLTAKNWVILSDSQAEWYLNEAKKETTTETQIETPKAESEKEKTTSEKAQEVIEAAKTGDIEKALTTTVAAVGGTKAIESLKGKDFSFESIKEWFNEIIWNIKNFISELFGKAKETVSDVLNLGSLNKGIDKLRQSEAWINIFSKTANYLGIDDTVKNYKDLLKEEKFSNLTIAELKKYRDKPEKASDELGLKSSTEKTKNVIETLIGSSTFDWLPFKDPNLGAYGSTKSDFEKTHWIKIDENIMTIKEYIEKLAIVDIS